MNKIRKKAQAFLLVYYAHLLEYRAEQFFWILSGTLPLIMMGVWIKASQGGQFALQPTDFARYFICVFIVSELTLVWVIWNFEREVVQGKLSPRLLQPVDPAWHHIAEHVSERFARLPLILLLVSFFFLLYPQAFWLPSWDRVLLFMLVSAIAFALRFLIQYTLAMFAFWTERAAALEEFWFLFHLFLSGMIAPLEVFPPVVQKVALWTPFPYLIDFPASLLIGLPVELGRSILVMLGWTVLFFFWNRWLWRKGLKQYSGMGA
ncbi:MAG: multidrug ABC transporter permease [Symploca sp. SIO2G7]|nr:multidrug ABC transporter permease [Symploca sp. SIO2G7]